MSSKSSTSEENEKIVNSAIDMEQQQEPPEQPPSKTVTIPLEQYQALMSANLTSHLNTLETLDFWDQMIATMTNCQVFAMNIKEKIKTKQLGLNKPPQQPQQLPEKPDAQ